MYHFFIVSLNNNINFQITDTYNTNNVHPHEIARKLTFLKIYCAYEI